MSKTNTNITTFYTKKELAKILKVSERSINNYMHQGLPYRKIGRTVRIPKDKLLKWLGGR